MQQLVLPLAPTGRDEWDWTPAEHLSDRLRMTLSGGAADDVAILLVDDDPRNLIALEALLAGPGLTVETATSGAECLRRLLRREFAVVLLDVQMPEMDGLETAAVIRGRPGSRHIPIIFLTAHHHTDRIVQRAFEIGAVDFLFKPLNADALRAKVSVFVELFRRGREIEAAERRAHEQSLAECRANLRAEVLREHAEALAESHAHKDRFLAMLGHELRNPLASMRYALELARRPAAKAFDPREVFERQLGQLERLVDDLLDISRISTGKIELSLQPTAIADVVEHAVEQCRPLLAAKQHTLDLRTSVAGLQMMADGVRLTQVIVNLLTNAARYTDPGGHIVLEGRRERDELVFAVSDDGAGISEEMLPRIFEAFVQAESEPGRCPQGLGLGLPLVRTLVEMHGGTVTATSAGLGRGSVFTVRVPIVEPPVSVTDSAPETSTDATGLDVVIVEDNDDVRELLQMFLCNLGHRVRVANDGLSGLRQLCDAPPEVAFVDLGLPGIDGFEVARRFCARHSPRRTRLVCVSGYGRPRDRALALESGYDTHIVKPIDGALLQRVLSDVAAARRKDADTAG